MPGLASAIGELLALVARLVFVLVSDRWQALRARQSRLISKREVKRIGVENLELSRAVRTVLQAAVFISFSEELERRGSVNKRGLFEGNRRITRAGEVCNTASMIAGRSSDLLGPRASRPHRVAKRSSSEEILFEV